MMGLCRTIAGRRAVIALAALIILSSTASLIAQENQAEGQLPDVLIWIDARSPGAHWVSITYPKVVPREMAEIHLGKLLQETRWAAEETNISDTSVMESGDFPMTSIEIRTSWAILPNTGILPIEPLVKAFRDQKNIEIQFLTPESFQFRGYQDFENKYVKITLNYGSNSYRYSIEVKDSEFTSLDLPSPISPAQPSSNTRSGISTVVLSVIIVLLALLLAIMAYLITSRLTAKGR